MLIYRIEALQRHAMHNQMSPTTASFEHHIDISSGPSHSLSFSQQMQMSIYKSQLCFSGNPAVELLARDALNVPHSIII